MNCLYVLEIKPLYILSQFVSSLCLWKHLNFE